MGNFATIFMTEAVVRRCSLKKAFFKNFAKFTGKYLCQSLFLIKRLWCRCFPMNFAKFLRKLFLKERLWWLLLSWSQRYSWPIGFIDCLKSFFQIIWTMLLFNFYLCSYMDNLCFKRKSWECHLRKRCFHEIVYSYIITAGYRWYQKQ